MKVHAKLIVITLLPQRNEYSCKINKNSIKLGNVRVLIEEQDLYIDYLISSFGAATNLSEIRDGAISHDKVTQMLAHPPQTSKDLWLRVKPLIRSVENDDGVLIIDDSLT